MRKLLLTACVALAACAAYSANMASQKWVEMKISELLAGKGVDVAVSNAVSVLVPPYVAEAVSNSLAITKAISPMAVEAGTNGMVYAFFEPATVPTLMATNSLNSTITNGSLFAWNDGGVYTNAALGAITSTETNFVWRATPSQVVDGIDTFVRPDGFGVTGLYVTPKQAKSIRGEE